VGNKLNMSCNQKGRSEALVTGVLSLTDYLQTRVSGRKKEVVMRQTIVATGILLAAWGALAVTAWAGEPNDMFIVRSSQKAPDEVVAQIERYAKDKKWIYLGSNKVKKGQVRLVKICIRAAGKELWKAGLHVSAMVPCGNLGIYEEKEVTQISLLHPRFMHMIYPDPNVKKAVEISSPLLINMMDEIGD